MSTAAARKGSKAKRRKGFRTRRYPIPRKLGTVDKRARSAHLGRLCEHTYISLVAKFWVNHIIVPFPSFYLNLLHAPYVVLNTCFSLSLSLSHCHATGRPKLKPKQRAAAQQRGGRGGGQRETKPRVSGAP